MRKRKYYLYLTAEERRVVINSLIDLRNNLIVPVYQYDYTDFLFRNSVVDLYSSSNRNIIE